MPTSLHLAIQMGLPHPLSVALGVSAGRKWWEVGRGGRRKKKNTLLEDYAASMPSLLQEFVVLN